MSSSDQKIADLENQVPLREMIYQILHEVGEPVVVPYEGIRTGRKENVQINAVHDLQADTIIFSITDVPEGADEH